MDNAITRFYKYPFQHRFELPIDSSLNDMERSSKGTSDEGIITRERIDSALKAIEPDIAPDDNYLYKELHYGNFKKEDCPRKTTTPAAILWETQNYIRDLCLAKYQGSRLKGENLAECFFKVSAQRLSKEDLTKFEDDYILTRYLDSPHIQKSLVAEYQNLVHLCCTKIETLLPSMPPHMATHFINATIHLTDDCILALKNQGNSFSQSAVEGMKKLYDSLCYARSNHRKAPPNDVTSQQSCTAGERYLFFKLALNDDKDSGSAIRNCLLNLTKDSHQELETSYRHYITTHFQLDEATKTELNRFVQNYSALLQQFKDLPEEISLEISLRQEFERYIEQLFTDFINNPFITFQRSYLHTTLFTGFLQDRIKNAHDHLIASVHEELTALYHPLSLIAIYNNDPSVRVSLQASPYVNHLYEELKALNAAMIKKLPISLIMPHRAQIEIIRDFFSCQPFDDIEITWRKENNYYTKCISTCFDYLMEKAYLLCNRCKSYLFRYADDIVGELLDLYRYIIPFHKELQEESAL